MNLYEQSHLGLSKINQFFSFKTFPRIVHILWLIDFMKSISLILIAIDGNIVGFYGGWTVNKLIKSPALKQNHIKISDDFFIFLFKVAKLATTRLCCIIMPLLIGHKNAGSFFLQGMTTSMTINKSYVPQI